MVTRLIQDTSVGPEAFQLDEVDIAERPEVAIKYGVTATPAVAIDGKLAFRGVPTLESLRARLRAASEASERP